MSIGIYAFLGANIDGLQTRVLENFEAIGFSVQFHPDTNLLKTPQGGCFYVRVDRTPTQLARVCPDTPLLVAFEYGVSKREKNASRKNGWPPKGVRQYTAIVSTRTASGRSLAAYYMQALTLAIMAKDSGGYFYVDVNEKAVTGTEGLEATLNELNSPTKMEFDADAFPFEQWPPLSFNSGESFAWAAPIRSAFVDQYLATIKTPKPQFKLPLGVKIVLILISCLVVVNFLYA